MASSLVQIAVLSLRMRSAKHLSLYSPSAGVLIARLPFPAEVGVFNQAFLVLIKRRYPFTMVIEFLNHRPGLHDSPFE